MSKIKTRIDALENQRTEMLCRHRRELKRLDRRLAKVQADCKHPRPEGGLFGIVTCRDCGKNLNKSESPR